MGAAAKAAQRNEALGVVPLHSMMQPSDHGFPQMVADWESLLNATRKEGSNRALQLAKAFITQAQNTPGMQHTEPGVVHTCTVQGQRVCGARYDRPPGGCVAWTALRQGW